MLSTKLHIGKLRPAPLVTSRNRRPHGHREFMGHTGHFDAYRYIHIRSVFVCLYVGAGALGRNDPPLQFGPPLSCLNPLCPPPPREDSPPPPPPSPRAPPPPPTPSAPYYHEEACFAETISGGG